MQKSVAGFSVGDNSAAKTSSGAVPASPRSSDEVADTDLATDPFSRFDASPAASGAPIRHGSTLSGIPRHPLPARDPLSHALRHSDPISTLTPASSTSDTTATTSRASSKTQLSAARSRRYGVTAIFSNSSPTPSAVQRDAQVRNGPARLAPLDSSTPSATLLSASATRRSLSSSITPSLSPSPPAISTSAAPYPLPDSPGNATERSIVTDIDQGDGSRAVGCSGIACRVSGNGHGHGHGHGQSNSNSNAGLLGVSATTVSPKYAIGSPVAPIIPSSIMGKVSQPDPPHVRRQRARSPWAITLLTLSVSLFGAALLGVILKSFVTRQFETDPKGCRMSYMRPSYAHISDFDTEHTRFASKYSLYLYREQGVDDETKVRYHLPNPTLTKMAAL